MAGIALILCGVASALNGLASVTGAAIRSATEPPLQRFRESSDMGRAELANASMWLAIALAIGTALASRSFGAVVMAALLVYARPSVCRMARNEHVLMAKAGNMVTDFVIGIYVPVILAIILFGNIGLAAALTAVALSLLWPTRGFGSQTGRRPIPVPAA